MASILATLYKHGKYIGNYLSTINGQDSCKWNLQFQGQNIVLDLSPLSGSTIYLQEEQYNQYYLEFTPCSNSVACSCYSSKHVMTAQITDMSNPTNCNGILAEYDNTQPTLSLNSDGSIEFQFEYPTEPSTCDAGCSNGRQQEIVYICDMNSTEPYNKAKSRFYETSKENNICYYHLELYTKYACVDVNVSDIGVKWIITTTDQSKTFEMQLPLEIMNGDKQDVLTINEGTTYQKMYGFGAALTQSSAYLLSQLKLSDSTKYWTLMDLLFNKSMLLTLLLLRTEERRREKRTN